MDRPNDRQTIIIIGAGIGGLATGCYCRMNGYDTHILEMGSCCGGVSVAWKRGDYLFDGATNWLPGSGPGANLHYLLKELFDFNRMPVEDPEIFIQVERDGQTLRVYTDADRLEQEMLAIAPQDRTTIAEFIGAVRTASRFAIPFDKPPELFSVADYLKFPFKNLPFIRFFTKWRRITIGEYATCFSSPALRSLFTGIFPHHDFFAAFSVIMALGWMHARSGGYPFGGSNRFAGLLEERYRSLGGKLTFRKRVVEIIVQDGRARGVRCDDGSIFAADTVISAADGHATLNQLLGGRFTPPAVKRIYASKALFPSLIQVGAGVAAGFAGLPHKLSVHLQPPIDAGDAAMIESMLVRVCDFDPIFAPVGKTAFVVHLRVPNWRWWVDLRENDHARYRAEKERIGREVIAALDRRFGNVAAQVETLDIATPATYIRYTGTWQGSYQSWAPTPDMVGRNLPKTLPGLKSFYMAGQWVWPAGGLPGVIRIGRHVAQLICRRDRKRFVIG
jgi:phytoene dehydrogenase-like protein